MTYENARDNFLKLYEELSSKHNVILNTYPIVDDLTMDSIEFIPENKEKLLCITTGLHGIEGYLGSILIEEFINKYIKQIDLETTHIVLIHSVNPYGMKYRRKVNENNVDLNRNFLKSFQDLPINKGYEKNKTFLLPKKLGFNLSEKFKFYFRVIKLMLTSNKNDVKEAVLLGQYQYQKGFYYGGNKKEKSTSILSDLFNQFMIEDYQQRIFIDIHTGYGPKNQMSIVNSPLEKRTVNELISDFNYPLIQKTDGDDFYKINGDMVDYLNELIKNYDYATCFEFGTLGDSTYAQIESLRMMIHENCIFHMKTNEKVTKKIKAEFIKLYSPNDEDWLQKAKQDFHQATDGILKHYHYIK